MTERFRDSSDLPDDVGTLFITDVPGSWLQVMGRRAYGELWIGEYVIQAKNQDSPATVLGQKMPGRGRDRARTRGRTTHSASRRTARRKDLARLSRPWGAPAFERAGRRQ
jgi:hypothetical protein